MYRPANIGASTYVFVVRSEEAVGVAVDVILLLPILIEELDVMEEAFKVSVFDVAVIARAPELVTPVELTVVVFVPSVTATEDKKVLEPDHLLVVVNNDTPPFNDVVMNE